MFADAFYVGRFEPGRIVLTAISAAKAIYLVESFFVKIG
jgi:hypothetical protein